jgi:hypothetical protein
MGYRGDERLWRHGGSTEDWPSAYEGRQTRWPDPPTRWTPTREAAIIACLRPDDTVQIIEFASIAEALEADRELYTGLCGSGCRRQHVLVSTTPGGRLHVSRGSHDLTPFPGDLSEARRAAGYRAPDTLIKVRCRPTPTTFNEPLHQPRGADMSAEQIRHAQDRALADNGRQMRPHPNGLAGRTGDALDDLALLTADPHATPTAIQSAQALADALVAALVAEDAE